ncbi:DNA repair helicase [Halobacteriales archaeon QS_9_67_15]|nr:MAG: DNA repair helicase [Halobacteriales archaeon QS_9_67_15]
MTVRLTYEDGTIRVTGDAIDSDRDGAGVLDLPFVERDERSKTLRAPAHCYPGLIADLDERGISYDDRVFSLPELSLDSAYELREYQRAALDDWEAADRRGVLELPTGSGKTVIGIAAMEAADAPTLVVVPTIDLLEQWRRELADVTVSTYDSAYLRADELGDRFGLVVFDEVHHLGGEGYRDIARLLATPARLGLTATFERPDGAHEVIADLVGSLAHRVAVDELAGEHLADYDIKRLEVSLTSEEREVYERHQETFTDYLAKSGIEMRSGSDYQELVKRSGTDPEAREALLAKQRAREVMMNAAEKVERLREILDRHRTDRVIVFTAHTDLVYRLSERFLIPAITHETGADERRETLARFRSGEYSRVVTANVLDEGVDVPDANVAVVLSGSGSEREFTQRLGRILRPKDGAVSDATDSGTREGTESPLGGRALLYEIVTEETAEERVSRRRR